jgi:hypothetical protein
VDFPPGVLGAFPIEDVVGLGDWSHIVLVRHKSRLDSSVRDGDVLPDRTASVRVNAYLKEDRLGQRADDVVHLEL